jgi:hypothetical protein
MLRNNLRSHGTLALYDSNSGVAVIPHSRTFRKPPGNPERQRPGALPEDIELIHEQSHWLQHIATGYGELLDRFRAWRDWFIFSALKKKQIPSETISRRIMGSDTQPIFRLLDASETLARVEQDADPFALACSFYWAEQQLTSPQRDRRSEEARALLGRCVAIAVHGLGYFSDEALSARRFSEQGLIHFTADDGDFFGTLEIQEAGAVLAELFVHRQTAEGREEGRRRFRSLWTTAYLSALSYAGGVLTGGTEQGVDFDALGLTLALAIDVALDVDFLRIGSINEMSPSDIYVPMRFDRVLRACRQEGCLPAKEGLSLSEIQLYRNTVRAAAGIRCASDGESGPAVIVEDEDLHRAFESATVLQPGSPPAGSQRMPNLYDFFRYLRGRARRLRQPRPIDVRFRTC